MKAFADDYLEKYLFKLFIIYEIIIFIVFAISKSFLIFAISAFLPLALVFLTSLQSKINWIYLLIFYTCFFPEANWGSRYDFFVHHVYPPAMLGLLGIVVFFWYLDLLRKPYRIIQSNMDVLVLALLLWLVFSGLWGLSKDHSFRYLLLEFVYLSLYGAYFIFRDIFRNKKHLKHILNFFLIVTFITSIQYILLFLSETSISSIIFKRVVTQQTHIIIIGYMILLNIVIFDDRKWYRIGAFIAILPHMLAMFFSQQRALWGAAFIGTIILILINGMRTFTKKTWIYVSIGMTIILIGVIFILIYIEDIVGGSVLFTTLSRIEFLFAHKADISLQSRMAEIIIVLKEWETSPVLGTGLGSSVNRFAARGNTNVVDNSFVNYLWKMGFVGFTIYMGIIFTFFSQGFRAIRNAVSVKEKNFIFAVLISLFSLMIIALTNSSLFIYRFNLIWAMLLAVVHRFFDKNVGLENENLHRR